MSLELQEETQLRWENYVYNGEISWIKKMFEEGFPIDYKNHFAIQKSIQYNFSYLYDFLNSEYKKDYMKELSQKEINALFYNTIKNGNVYLYEELTKKNVQYEVMVKFQGLEKAIEYGHLDIIQHIIEHNSKNMSQYNYLLVLAANFGEIDIFNYFVSKGCDIHYNKDEALIKASQHNHIEIVEECFKHNCNLYTMQDEPLKRATTYGHIEMVKFLFLAYKDKKHALDVIADIKRKDVLKEMAKFFNSYELNQRLKHELEEKHLSNKAKL